jgi:tetratricopeptide (TPR) repeat protein
MEWSFQWSQDPQALERALALGQQALALDDSLSAAHVLMGFIYARKQQYDQALAEGERAVALNPNNADGYAGQANALCFMGRPEEAVPVIEQAIRLNPHYPAVYLVTLGFAYQLTGRDGEAIVAYKRVLVRNPNFLHAHINLGSNYLRQWISQLDQGPQTLEWASEAARRAIALNDAAAGGHLSLGYVYLCQKQYEQALAEIERATALAPNEAWSYASLADMLSRVGKPEDALGAAEKALHLQSSGPRDQHLNLIGSAYYLAGRPKEALAPLRQFLSRYPNILGAHLALAAAYGELGKEAEAQAEAAEVLRLNPQFSLEVHKQRAPIKDPAVLERQLAALRKAGLK